MVSRFRPTFLVILLALVVLTEARPRSRREVEISYERYERCTEANSGVMRPLQFRLGTNKSCSCKEEGWLRCEADLVQGHTGGRASTTRRTWNLATDDWRH